MNDKNAYYEELNNDESSSINSIQLKQSYITDDDNDFYIEENLSSFKISSINNSNNIKISQKETSLNFISIINIANFCCMFNNCHSLISFSTISKWNTSKIRDMSYLFNGCNSLLSLPNLSEWDTSNTKDINHMFNECKSLNSLPNISNWNTSKFLNIMFFIFRMQIIIRIT